MLIIIKNVLKRKISASDYTKLFKIQRLIRIIHHIVHKNYIIGKTKFFNLLELSKIIHYLSFILYEKYYHL